MILGHKYMVCNSYLQLVFHLYNLLTTSLNYKNRILYIKNKKQVFTLRKNKKQVFTLRKNKKQVFNLRNKK